MSGSKLSNPDYVTHITAEMENDSSKYIRFLPQVSNKGHNNIRAPENNVTRI